MALHRNTLELLSKIQANAEQGVEDWNLIARFMRDAELDGETLHEATQSLQGAIHRGYLYFTMASGRRYLNAKYAPVEPEPILDKLVVIDDDQIIAKDFDDGVPGYINEAGEWVIEAWPFND